MEATIPYVERDSNGEIVALYGTVAPMFAQARTYLSTGKLQERLDEYPAVHEEAARLGVTFDEAVGHADDIHDPEKRWTICGRWPEWIDDAELTSQLQDIRQAYEESHDDAGAGGVDVSDPADPDLGGDPGEPVEAGPDADPGEPADYSAEPVGDDPELAGAGAYPGVMVQGDPLKAAQMELTWSVGDKEDELVSQYPADENLARLNELRGIALAIKEGVHPAFDEETAAELQALETFASWLSAVRTNADRLRNAIRQAADQDALGLIDINAGWPE